jgi:ribosomal protein S18 acetylase RimI-like enzyme
MPRVSIREYREDDWQVVCQIHDRARPMEVAGFMPRDVVLPMEQSATADGFFQSKTSVAYLDDGRIVGFVSIRPPELTWCYVDPSLHRQGIGRKLVEHVLSILGADGFVLCNAENPTALAFYKSFGFIIAARFPGEVQGYRCECVRLTMPTSRHRHRPPTPTISALRLAGFTNESPGMPTLGADGIYYWR